MHISIIVMGFLLVCWVGVIQQSNENATPLFNSLSLLEPRSSRGKAPRNDSLLRTDSLGCRS